MSVEKLREMFPHRLDFNWSPRSPNFSAPDYFVWGYLKGHVFDTLSATFNEVKADIREAIHDVLQRVVDDSTKRFQECISFLSDLICKISEIF
jgi:hypothetical protein